MQIQAGAYRGRKIRQLSSLEIRPCSSRVKKSLFDTISARMDFDGIDVLDLFAGFGSLGFEALSRGAGHACFVEQNARALAAMRATAEELGVTGRVRFANTDAVAFLVREDRRYDLVFCDPPYRWEDYDTLIGMIAGDGILSEDGMLVMEHHARLDFSRSGGYLFHKDYGTTRVSFFTHERTT